MYVHAHLVFYITIRIHKMSKTKSESKEIMAYLALN